MTDAKLLPIIWTLASMVIAVLVTLIFSPARADRFRSTLAGRIIEQIFRLIYFIGIPYAALLTHSLSAVDLGFMGNSGSNESAIFGWTSADWLRGLNTGLTLGLIVLIPIGLAGRQMARAGSPLGVDMRSTGSIVIDSVYSEVHWAFYRSAVLILLGSAYGAALIGVLLVSIELVVAIARNGLGTEPEDRQSWIGQALLLTMSATTFILTRNVWLAIALHMVIEVTLKAIATRLAMPVKIT